MNEYRGKQVQLDVLCLAADETRTVAAPAGDEAVLVLLEGEVEWEGVQAVRHSVFETRASAVFLPPGCAVDVTAGSASELALATTVDAHIAGQPGAVPALLGPDDVVVQDRGQPGWHRKVHDIAVDQVAASRLMVGETFNEPGQWSSFPPHKHDHLEEVYYYRFDRPEGFGFQGLYEPGADESAVMLRHGRVVGFAHGYHPVCAAPGYRLYYLWALAGTPRRLAMEEDPAHTWLNDGRR